MAFVEWVDLRDLGPHQLLYNQYASIGELLAGAAKYMPLGQPAMTFRFEQGPTEAHIIYALQPDLRHGSEQFMEMTLSTCVKIIRNLLDPSWRPLAVEFQHAAQSAPRRAFTHFCSAIRFQEADYAVVFDRSDLRVRRNDRDRHLVELIGRYLEERALNRSQGLPGEVKETITWLLRDKKATLAQTSAALGLAPRPLQRRLVQSDTDFQSLLREVRIELAKPLLDKGKQPLAGLATVLGYSEPSAASRFVGQHVRGRRRDS